MNAWLLPGNTIGVVAPASGFDADKLAVGIAHLEHMGYRVKLAPNVHARDSQFFAGTVAQRVSDLHAMFADAEVKLIIAVRGGYGCDALLPSLDLNLIRSHPKPLLGCSDLTTLQGWLAEQAGTPTWHGPMVAGDFARGEGLDLRSFLACAAAQQGWTVSAEQGLTQIKPGTATGFLRGGCMSLLTASLATPYELLREPQADMILFVEDVNEPAYKIQRMWTQLERAGKLRHVRGIVFGEMLHCESSGGRYTLRDVVARLVDSFNGPVGYGLRSGHVTRGNVTLPLGYRATLTCQGQATLALQV